MDLSAISPRRWLWLLLSYSGHKDHRSAEFTRGSRKYRENHLESPFKGKTVADLHSNLGNKRVEMADCEMVRLAISPTAIFKTGGSL